MARQESIIQIKVTTAVVIVIAMISGTFMVLSRMSTLSTTLNQSVMGVHQRVSDIKTAVDVQLHMMDRNVSLMDELMGTVLETTDTQQELIQSTSEIQQRTITALEEVNSFLAKHADTPEEVDATE